VLFALTLAEHTSPGLDLGRVVRLCALHDLVEIDAGDTFFWDEKGYADKEARERAAARRLFGLLPTEQGQAYEALWEEFEACQSAEAVYANAVDRLAPVMLNTHSGGRSWRENGITAEKILSKMSVIAQASPRLGRALENLVKAAAEKGFLGTAP
jgi:putative hydrolase of HD superfamily